MTSTHDMRVGPLTLTGMPPAADGVVTVSTANTWVDGFRWSFRVTGLPSDPVVLAHPNLDQESHGACTRRLGALDRVRRGFDQALVWPSGALVLAAQPHDWVTQIEVSVDDDALLVEVIQEQERPVNGPRTSDPVRIGWFDDPFEGLAACAPTGLSCDAIRGWNSWDFYGWNLTGEIVAAEAAAAPEGFDWIGLTGPWFDAIGDWNPMPWALEAIARLRAAGKRVNLWVAPFMAEETSALYRRHPEWLLDGVDGRITRGSSVPVGVLDASNPAVREHLRALAARLSGVCDYLFVDFVRVAENGTAPRYDTSMTGAASMRAGMRALVEGAGAGTIVMACSGTIGLYHGVCHAARIGPDITLPPLGNDLVVRLRDGELGTAGRGYALASWDGVGGVRKQVAAIATRWHWSHRSFVPNPDAVLLVVSEAQARTTAALWALTGGIYLSGDSLVMLPNVRRDLLIHPALLDVQSRRRAAKPADLFQRPGHMPSVWQLDEVTAYVNWDDQPMLVRATGVDLWTGRRVDGIVEIAPHDTALIAST